MSADRSVRVAWVADAEAMGRVQAAAWRDSYATVWPSEVLGSLDPSALAEAWATSIRRPPLGTYRALVALARNDVVGVAATGPSDDPDADQVADAEMSLLVVDPAARGQGHGSRLLAAVADTARADGFVRLTTWVLSADDAVRRFLGAAGWEPDGAHREVELGDDAAPLRQVRLHTALEDA